MATTIVTKNGSGVPLDTDLLQGELAVDLEGQKLYSKNASGTVVEIAPASEASSLSWDDVENKPTEFPPSPHVHPWGEITDKPDLVEEAPDDGKQYVRESEAWAEIVVPDGGGAGAGMVISETEPTDKVEGMQWLNPTTGLVLFWDAEKWLQMPGGTDGADGQDGADGLWTDEGNNTISYSGTVLVSQPDAGADALAVGQYAGLTTQGERAVGVGFNAGKENQGDSSVAIGRSSGATSQGNDSVAVGRSAGNNAQGQSSVAVGYAAGDVSQGDNAVAVGPNAGKTTQGVSAVALGHNAGQINQGEYTVAVGMEAGKTNQENLSTAVGCAAGYTDQGAHAVAVGYNSGVTAQGTEAVSVGYLAGYDTQGQYGVGVGFGAGYENQGTGAVAIGGSAGNLTQGASAVSIGGSAGEFNQGAEAIAIGKAAGQSNQAANSIIINATGVAANLAYAGISIEVPGAYLNYDGSDQWTFSGGNVYAPNITTREGPVITAKGLIKTLSTLRNATKDETTLEGMRDALADAIGGLIEGFEHEIATMPAEEES